MRHRKKNLFNKTIILNAYENIIYILFVIIEYVYRTNFINWIAFCVLVRIQRAVLNLNDITMDLIITLSSITGTNSKRHPIFPAKTNFPLIRLHSLAIVLIKW